VFSHSQHALSTLNSNQRSVAFDIITNSQEQNRWESAIYRVVITLLLRDGAEMTSFELFSRVDGLQDDGYCMAPINRKVRHVKSVPGEARCEDPFLHGSIRFVLFSQ
jgi:hypothetical protein